MKTFTKALFLFALNTILFSCNQGGLSSTKDDDIKPKTESKKAVQEISTNSNSLMYNNYVGNFLIKENDTIQANEVFQAVYSSQNYGTFYQIYCKPYIASKSKILDSLEFSIINYKGILNLGFSENEYHKSEFGYDDGELIVKLVVRGNSNVKSKVIDVRGKNIKKEDLDTLFIYRILLSLYEDRTMSANRIFDSEFLTRSGFEYSDKKLVPGLDGYFRSNDSLKGLNFDELLVKNKLFNIGAGRNCYSAVNKVMWY